jgi:hypothetical protein
MQTTRRFLVAVILCIVCGDALLRAADGDSIVGEWQSFELGGGDIGDHIKSVTFVFRGDGTFTGSATLADGKTDTHSGKYKVADGVLELTVENEDSQKGTYSLTDGILTLHDSALKSWVKFKRAASEPPGGKAAK